MNEIKISAKTVDEAVKIALDRLEASIDDVTVDVVEEGTKGIFGLGSKDATVVVTLKDKESDAAQTAKRFVDEIIDKMNLVCVTDVSEDENGIKITVSGPGVGGIIGRRGETLDAVQYLTCLLLIKASTVMIIKSNN